MKPPGIPQVGIDYLRNQSAALMTSTVTIKRPAVPVYSASTGYAVGTTSQTGYSGPAHIHPATGGAVTYQADQLVGVMQVPVSIPWDASPVPIEDDQVLVVATEDPALLGRTLRIVDVSKGGIGFPVRLLSCTFIEAGPFDPSA